MDQNEHLLDRTDLGFRLVNIRDAAGRAHGHLGAILAACPPGRESQLGPEVLLAIGARLGALDGSIQTLGQKLDERCPEIRPPLSEQLGHVEFDRRSTARETLEAAEAALRNAVAILDAVNRHLVSEIDEELPVSTGPADDAILAWLRSGAVDTQP